MEEVKTHILLLDLSATSIVLCEGNKEQCELAYVKWLEEIKSSKWISLPNDCSVSLNTNFIVSVRVVELPKEVQEASRLMGAKTTLPFVQKSKDSGQNLLDEGYK